MTVQDALGDAGVVARVVFGAVLLAAGIAKFRMRGPFEEAVVEFALIPKFAQRFIIKILPMVEIVLGVLLLTGYYASIAILGALTLLHAFTAASIATLARSKRVSCGCFGRRTDVLTWRAVIPNIGLIAMGLGAASATPPSFTISGLLVHSHSTQPPVELIMSYIMAAAIIAAWRVYSIRIEKRGNVIATGPHPVPSGNSFPRNASIADRSAREVAITGQLLARRMDRRRLFYAASRGVVLVSAALAGAAPITRNFGLALRTAYACRWYCQTCNYANCAPYSQTSTCYYLRAHESTPNNWTQQMAAQYCGWPGMEYCKVYVAPGGPYSIGCPFSALECDPCSPGPC